MALHPKILAGLERLKHLPRMDQLTLALAREQMRSLALAIVARTPPPEIGAVVDLALAQGAIRSRIYSPAGTGPFPLVHFFHGGGFVAGDLDSYDYICRTLCGRTGAVVLATDYRLAPEHRYPAAVDDCLAAIRSARANASALNADPARTAVAGDSAGGNLAAVCALRLRSEQPPLRAQLLVYPATDHFSSAHASHSEYADGYGLTSAEMRWFWNHYLPDPALAQQESVSPLRARDLAGLPPALVIGAECDVLRDEGSKYAQRLRSSGVQAEYRLAEGMNHGFWLLASALAEAHASLCDASDWLRAALK
jgi:acetyl esterase